VPANQPRKPRGTPVGGQFDRTLGGGAAMPSLDMPRELDENYYHRRLLERVSQGFAETRQPDFYHCGCQSQKHLPKCPFGLAGHVHMPTDPYLFGSLLAANGEITPFKNTINSDGFRTSLRDESLPDDAVIFVRMGVLNSEAITNRTIKDYPTYRGLENQSTRNGLFCISTFRIAEPLNISGILDAAKYKQLGLAEFGHISDIVRAIPTSEIHVGTLAEMAMAQSVHHDLVIDVPDNLNPREKNVSDLSDSNRSSLQQFVEDRVSLLTSRFEKYFTKEIK